MSRRREQIRSRAEHRQRPHQPSVGGGQNHADHDGAAPGEGHQKAAAERPRRRAPRPRRRRLSRRPAKVHRAQCTPVATSRRTTAPTPPTPPPPRAPVAQPRAAARIEQPSPTPARATKSRSYPAQPALGAGRGCPAAAHAARALPGDARRRRRWGRRWRWTYWRRLGLAPGSPAGNLLNAVLGIHVSI
jgi:hypothetical protein